MLRKIGVVLESLRNYGLKATIKRVIAWFKLLFSKQMILNFIKVHESNRYKIEYQGRIIAGLFKGVRLERLHWGRRDFVSMSTGNYEREVLRYLEITKGKFDFFIDVGAADGYYAVGGLTVGLFKTAIAFEISQAGRSNILTNASCNGVSSILDIRGEFHSSSLNNDIHLNLSKSLIMFDIEGGEFDLLDNEFIERHKLAHLIIELHVSDQKSLVSDNFYQMLAKHYQVSILLTGGRNPFVDNFMQGASEDLKWLLVSDGRNGRGNWLVCCPAKCSECSSIIANESK